MSQERDVIDYLNDILDAIEKAEKFLKGLTFEAFDNDEKTQFAVIRALEILSQ